jgi:hypothetical protein
MAGIGTRFTIERVMIGNYLPKVARACALLDPYIDPIYRFCLKRVFFLIWLKYLIVLSTLRAFAKNSLIFVEYL